MTSEDASRTARMLWVQVRHHNRTFWRNPLGAFFTIAFPLFLLLILGGLFGGDMLLVDERWLSEGEEVEGAVPFAQVIAPAVAAFAVAMSGYVQLASSTATDRAEGTLKRLRGTPMPPAVYLAGRLVSAMWIAAISAVLVLAAGLITSELAIDWTMLPAAVAILLLGSATFALLGLALVSLVRPGSVQAVAFGTILPLSFISGLFIHGVTFPPVLSAISWTFPLRHLNVALRDALGPIDGWSVGWQQPAVLVIWALLAAAVALTRFPWDAGTEPGQPRGLDRAARRPGDRPPG